jgi:prepilin-type N-terminal cleavage/methylation domain-containing protein
VRRQAREESGFTLLEVLIAVVVLGIIMAIIYQSYWVCSKTVAAAEQHSDVYQEARLALRRIGDDLMCAWLPLTVPTAKDDSQGSPGAGEKVTSAGDSDSTEGGASGSGPAFKAVNIGSDADARDTLEFVTTANLARGSAGQLDTCQVQYSVQEGDKGKATLVRTSSLANGDSEGAELASNVKALDFKFFNAAGEQFDDWDSTQSNTLPATVQITLVMGTGDGQDEGSARREGLTFTTAVNIPLAWERDSLGKEVAALMAKQEAEAKAKAKDKAKSGDKSKTPSTGTSSPQPSSGDQTTAPVTPRGGKPPVDENEGDLDE